MQNGDVNEFVEKIHNGEDLIFTYRDQKFFLQGWYEKNKPLKLVLDRWEPPGDDYIWVGIGDARAYPVEEFLAAKLWDGRNFWDAEHEMTWVDD